jgi:hypothetical protein
MADLITEEHRSYDTLNISREVSALKLLVGTLVYVTSTKNFSMDLLIASPPSNDHCREPSILQTNIEPSGHSSTKESVSIVDF